MDLSSLFNRILKNYKKLDREFQGKKIGAYRLYDRDIPEFPLIIEIFRELENKSLFAVIWPMWERIDSEAKQKEIEDTLPTFFKESLKVEKCWIKQRKIQRTNDYEQYGKQGHEGHIIIIKEGELKFKINLSDYLDVGLYLDHRPLRQNLFKHSPKNVLNLFSYTCSLGVAYAQRGAQVTNVDLSKKYLEWGRENFYLNQLLDKGQFVASDIREFLKSTTDKYDLIIIDAPTFSNSKDLPDFDVKHDHTELIKLANKKLKNEGEIIFSCNLRGMKLNTDFEFLDFSEKSTPIDFKHKPHVLYVEKLIKSTTS